MPVQGIMWQSKWRQHMHTARLSIVAGLLAATTCTQRLTPSVLAAPPARTPIKTQKPAASKTDPVDAYMATVRAKIQKSWQPPEKGNACKLVVTFTISTKGPVDEVKLKESSGHQAIDDSAVAAIKNASPFAALPPAAAKGLTIDYTFNFRPRDSESKADTETYMKGVAERINKTWQEPKVPKKMEVAITFTIDKSGKVIETKINKTSGLKALDDAAVNAVKRAAPFAPLPPAFDDKMTIGYTFQASPGQGGPDEMKWNGVNLSQAGYQVSRGGATMKPLSVDTAIERKLQERTIQNQDRIIRLREELAENEKRFGADSVNAARTLREMARCEADLHQYGEAEKHFQAALASFEKVAEGSPELMSTLSDLGQLCVSTGRLKEGEPLLARAAKLSSNFASEQERRQVLEHYARLLYKLNKVAEANEIYKQLK